MESSAASAAPNDPVKTPAAAPSPEPPALQPQVFRASTTLKETAESVLLALILAFIFRAFVVEAFVIPTGSMAPTLLGAHMRYTCQDCGYRFDANYQAMTEQQTLRIPTYAGPVLVERRNPDGSRRLHQEDQYFTIHCPNCGFRVPKQDAGDPENDAENPRVHFGDRILVLKYQYLLREPQRWDVIVFKSPADPEYQTNFIKRLVGLPGETIMILDGDVYSAWPGAAPEQFRVERKPPHVQEALWRIVYDNDHHPRQLPRKSQRPWEQPWKQLADGSGWDLGAEASTGRAFRFRNDAGGATLVFDRRANDATHALTDWLAYDIENGPPNNFVGDLKIALTYRRESGEGPLMLALTKLGHRFAAEFTPGRVRLVHTAPDGGQSELGAAALPESAQPLRIEFSNADYAVSVRVDGRPLIDHRYAPDVGALLTRFDEESQVPPAVEIGAEKQSCTLEHLSLWRDVYYINRGGLARAPWASPRDFPQNLIHLGPDEYFVLGDNTLVSQDSRYWGDRVVLPHEELDVDSGRVPGRFLLGKAFFVYWPAGHPPFDGAPSVAPNFGDMRFIR